MRWPTAVDVDVDVGEQVAATAVPLRRGTTGYEIETRAAAAAIIMAAEREGRMDVIAEWLAAARTSGTVFSRSELSAPWCFEYPAAPRIAFHLIARGRAWLRVGEQRPQALGEGDIVLLASGQQHVVGGAPTGDAESVYALFQRHPLGRDRTLRLGDDVETVMICGAYELDPTNSGTLLSMLPPLIHLPGTETSPTAARARATLQLLVQEMGLGEHAGDAVLRRLVDVLLIYVLRAWGEAQPATSHGWLVALRDPTIAVALARVHEQPARDWTVADLAAEAGTSRSVFARQFTTSVGEPPLAYVTRWRMTLAARLLVDTPLPMAAVAARVGYLSEHAFSRAFSRAKGMPPGQWRSEVALRSTGSS